MVCRACLEEALVLVVLDGLALHEHGRDSHALQGLLGDEGPALPGYL